MANPRGELALLELEAKALKAVDTAWEEYNGEGKALLVPTKLVTLIIDVHKMIMQRMSAKYGLDAGAADLLAARAALNKEMELLDVMIQQQNMGIQ